MSSLKTFRERRGWTQAMLAQQSGVPRSTISAIENGALTPSVSTALALARALGVSVETYSPMKLPEPFGGHGNPLRSLRRSGVPISKMVRGRIPLNGYPAQPSLRTVSLSMERRGRFQSQNPGAPWFLPLATRWPACWASPIRNKMTSTFCPYIVTVQLP